MKVLMVNDYFGFSAGAFAVAWEMSRELLARGHQVAFLCADEEAEEEGLTEIQGREVVRLPVRTHPRLRPFKTIYRPGLTGRALAWIKRLEPDVVHGHVLHLHLSFGLAAAVDRAGLPVVLTAHDTGIFCPTKYVCQPPEEPDRPARAKDCAACLRLRYLPGRAGLTRGLVNRHVKAVAAVSRSLAGILTANKVKRVEVIPNGLDPELLAQEGWSARQFRESLDLGEGPLILFGGRLHRLKGDEEALRALAWLPASSRARLVVAGREELFGPRLKRLARELKVEERIVLAGWLTRERMLGAYRAAAAVLVPSIYPDPFPTVNLEAMALARPVVGTRFGGTPEVVDHGRTGFVVDPRDPEETGSALGRLLAEPDLARTMGQAGRERIAREFSLGLQVDRFEELYGRFLRGA